VGLAHHLNRCFNHDERILEEGGRTPHDSRLPDVTKVFPVSTSQHQAIVEDTYAEGFRSIYAEILVTARDRTWLDHACAAATGHASSSIFCECEAGVDRYVGPDGDESFATPDDRPGAVIQFHVPRFKKDREKLLEKVLLHRISQNILTCPTTACFNLLESETYFKLGRKIAFFGDGHQFRQKRHGREMWVIPIMGGEFVLDRRFGFADGIMGGNLWFFASSVDASLAAAERGVKALAHVPGTIAPFPGGIAASGSKAGSAYSFLFASTNHPFCPTLRGKLGVESQVPEGIESIMEIIINGRDLATVSAATQAVIAATIDTPGLIKISAGNYHGRLGKSFIYLRPELHM
jgi:formylmethanofuran--tetrahydromethanopterin N-formyltransferase